jgi:GNAT superfamily N-acetyltransferase
MLESEIIIRNAEDMDIPRIIELWKEHLDYHAKYDSFFERAEGSETGFQKYLTDNLANIGLYIAEINSKIVGFILLEIEIRPPCFVNRNFGMISDIAVTKEFRFRTIGKQLLKHALPWFKERNINRIETRILVANPSATAFWSSAGFNLYMNCSYLQI